MKNKQVDNQGFTHSWDHSYNVPIEDASLMLNHEGTRTREDHMKSTPYATCNTSQISHGKI